MSKTIKMQFPARAKYIKAIRLAICAIASELEFDFDEIEDIKLCVSEACIMVLCKQICDDIIVEVDHSEKLSVCVKGEITTKDSVRCCEECTDFNEEISRIIVESLMDETVFKEDDGVIKKISFTKKPMKNQGE